MAIFIINNDNSKTHVRGLGHVSTKKVRKIVQFGAFDVSDFVL